MQNIDVGAVPIYRTERRAQVVSYSVPFLQVRAAMLMMREEYGGPYNVRTLQDVLAKNLTVATNRRGIVRKNLRRASDTVQQQIHQRLETHDRGTFVETVSEGVDRTKSDMNFVFLLPDVVANYVSNRQPCSLKVVNVELMQESFALLVNNESPALLQRINWAIISLSQQGVIEKLYRKWWNIDTGCDAQRLETGHKSVRSPAVLNEGYSTNSMSSFRLDFSNSLFVWSLVTILHTVLTMQ